MHPSSQLPAPSASPSRVSNSLKFVLAALTALGAALLGQACNGNQSTGTPGGPGGGQDECVDGVIVDGVCEGKCDPTKCVEGNTCVGNRCVLKCDAHRDCYHDGGQDCAPAKEDDTNADILVCQANGMPVGMGVACPFGGECAGFYRCADDTACFGWQCGGDPAACVTDTAACNGDPSCRIGKCAADGAACRVGCQTECTQWLQCETFGEGDADAYCTARDCASDDDCVGGFFCGVIRTPYSICGTSKGDNNFCGLTSEACKTPGQDGTSLFEGSLCMLRKSCLKRLEDMPCQTDLDCSQKPGLRCADVAGEKRCARTCGLDNDCQKDKQCLPLQGDTSGALVCVPRFGAWKGTGAFCDPCIDDTECGDATTSRACSELSSGMRACFDQAFPDACTTDADCPTSKSGKHGVCLDESWGVSSGSTVYHRCYLPINDPNTSDGKVTCW